MPTLDVLTHSTAGALEAMFFTSILESVEASSADFPPMNDTWTAATLEFNGDVRGEFALAASPGAARSIAANFLGADTGELSSDEIGEVVCELTNMIAGSIVSSLESNRSFDLSHPESGTPAAVLKSFSASEAHLFAIEEGHLAIWLRIQ